MPETANWPASLLSHSGYDVFKISAIHKKKKKKSRDVLDNRRADLSPVHTT